MKIFFCVCLVSLMRVIIFVEHSGINFIVLSWSLILSLSVLLFLNIYVWSLRLAPRKWNFLSLPYEQKEDWVAHFTTFNHEVRGWEDCFSKQLYSIHSWEGCSHDWEDYCYCWCEYPPKTSFQLYLKQHLVL